MELDELCGNLYNALYYLLADPPHHVTLHLEDRASPNHFGSLYILKFNITTRDTTCTDDCPEIRSGRENHLLKQISCSISTGNLPLAEKFHVVVLDHLDESKLTHLLWVADVQTTWVHFKEWVRETKLLAMDDESHLNFAIICDPVDCNHVLYAYDVGDSLLAKPNPELVSWELALLGDLQTTAIAYHV
jgi:hypothetical protein